MEKFDSTKVLEQVMKLCGENKLDAATDLLYETVDDLCFAGGWFEIDSLLFFAEYEKMPPSLSLSFLTITSCVKDKLNNRNDTVLRLEAFYRTQFDEEKVKRLLIGLR